MAEYQLTANEEPCSVIRDSDKACIPPDPANRDYGEYLQWVEDGGVPDPYVPPVPMPPTVDQQAARANLRLDNGVVAAVDALPVTKLSPPHGPWPACSVYQSTTQAIIKNTPTKINFNTVEYDTTGAFSVATSRFQPKDAGYYQISCGCGVAAGSVQNHTSIYKNGNEYRRSTTSSDGGNTRLSTLVHLNGTTDYAEGFVNISQNFSTVSGVIMTSFSAVLVQPETLPYETQQRVTEIAAAVKALLEAHAEQTVKL